MRVVLLHGVRPLTGQHGRAMRGRLVERHGKRERERFNLFFPNTSNKKEITGEANKKGRRRKDERQREKEE